MREEHVGKGKGVMDERGSFWFSDIVQIRQKINAFAF
jgi:hypothetical protein